MGEPPAEEEYDYEYEEYDSSGSNDNQRNSTYCGLQKHEEENLNKGRIGRVGNKVFNK